MTTTGPHTTKTKRRRKAQLSNFDQTTISSALRLLESLPSERLRIDAKQYATGYLALRHLIRDNIDFRNHQELLAASYAVYGWMPTILKKFENIGVLSNFILRVKPLPLAEAAEAVRDEVTSNDGQALQALNNSVVGTSKLLHFVRPDLFPIWDSRIAELFRFRNASHNTPAAYLGYFELVHAWCSSANTFPESLRQILTNESPEGDPISHIRLTEYCLFLASVTQYGGGSERSQEE
ncbi:hypothetical protein JQ636_07610 [Bradyrhizobium japonicum]|uniref:hypothetical protein n=1 Tax=Bradyrhizobium japonicum TaxID=375 RepID=UPI001BA45122|nr:hypothetical protein [Bradyrhizobium japonicum]MBR0803404.1 hypothetical protein [Bradyrhizobium japonicum]